MYDETFKKTLDTAAKAVKAFPWKCSTKAEHKYKATQVRELMDNVLYPLHPYMFTSDIQLKSYYNELHMYEFTTKKKLDDILWHIEQHCKYQITAFYSDMEG